MSDININLLLNSQNNNVPVIRQTIDRSEKKDLLVTSSLALCFCMAFTVMMIYLCRFSIRILKRSETVFLRALGHNQSSWKNLIFDLIIALET